MGLDIERFADDLGPEKILYLADAATGLRAVLVVDNTACGPAIGGCRMAPDVTVEECYRLARAMTLKNAAAGLPHGGGKSVIAADPHQAPPDKERLVRSFARAIRGITEYIVGPDMGTDETAMAWCRDEIGRAVGLPREIGGIPLDEIGATGFGLAIAAEAVQAHGGPPLAGARIAVQGFGSVGFHAARYLVERGARLVAASDSGGAVHAPDGLDPVALRAHKGTGASLATYPGGTALPGETIVSVECDYLVPAARPDVVTAANAASVRARVVLCGANIPATAQAESALHARGVLVVPDFIANAGGVICASVEYHGGDRSRAFATIEEKIRANTSLVLERAAGGGEPPRAAATALAAERVRRAMGYRR